MRSGERSNHSQDLSRYVPRRLAEWDLDAPGVRWQRVDGTLCFVDISGFTNLSEKLARRGRIGAEELTEVLSRVFGSMLRLAYDRRGNLLKFGGDALLILFEGNDHPMQAVSAAVEMRAALREATRIPTSVGRISLRMSIGLHTGAVDLFRAGESHQELVITGVAATATTEMEHAAEAGEILISPALRDALPPDAASVAKGPGFLLRWRKPPVAGPGATPRRPVEEDAVAACVPTLLRRHLSVGRAEPEHRLATVGFIRFQGVEATMASGPLNVAAGLDQLIGSVQKAADHEGVTFLATDIDADGGKIILVSGVPATQEDDEGRVLRAVRRIADSRPVFAVKIGVNRGHVFAGEIGTDFRSTYTVMGDTVNLAARLMAAAPPGSIYAIPGALDRSHTLFETTPLAPFRVKGKAAPVQAYKVGEEIGTRIADSHRELPFTGRTEELTTLRASLDRLHSGLGEAVTVIGDTGIGKTRLVEEALSGVEGFGVLTIRAEAIGADTPYWAFRDPLRRGLAIERQSQPDMSAALASAVERIDPGLLGVLPLIGDATHIDVPDTPDTAEIEPRFRPDRVAAAVAQLLGALFPGRLVVVGEDAHWFDEASAGLLARLEVIAKSRPWLLLITTRPGSEGSSKPLGTSMPLGPLSDEEARSVVIAATEAAPLRPHEIESVVARTGGNPLFLEEILRLIRETGNAEALPDSLDAVVGAEIDSLPPLPRRLLRYSSVLGRSFRRVVLDELLAPEEVVLDRSTRRIIARFVEADGPDRWRFRHAVIHDVAYQGLSYRRRRELHARAGEVIERLAGDSPEDVAELLAWQYSLAGSHDKAWRYSRLAGDKARYVYANDEAAGHYVRALESARYLGIGALEKVDVLSRLGEVYELAGRFPASLDAYRRASRLVADDPLRCADLLLRRARTRLHEGSYRAALGEAMRGYRVAGHSSDPQAAVIKARLTAIRAHLRQRQHKAAKALALATQAASEAEVAGDDEALARAYLVSDWAHHMLGSPQLAVQAEKALAIYERTGNRDGAGNVLNNLGGVAYFEGRWDDSVAWYRRAEDSYRRAGNEASAAVARGNIAEVLVSQFRTAEAEPVITDAIRVLRAAESPDDLLFVELQKGRLLINQEDYAAAVEHLAGLRRQLLDLGQTGFAFEAAVQLSLGLVGCGRPSEVAELLDDAVKAVGKVDALYAPMMARIRGSALAAMSRFDEAEEILALGASQAREQGLAYEEGLLLLAKAACAQRMGRPSQAEELGRGHQLLKKCGVRLEGAPRVILLPTASYLKLGSSSPKAW